MTATDGAWWGPILFLAEFLAFIGVCYLTGRAFDRYLTRKQSEAHEEIADPILAAHRGHTTRLVRALDRGDEQIRRAVEEHEQTAGRRRQTVPKQIQGERR